MLNSLPIYVSAEGLLKKLYGIGSSKVVPKSVQKFRDFAESVTGAIKENFKGAVFTGRSFEEPIPENVRKISS